MGATSLGDLVMYKLSTELQHYLRRHASHSTKPYRTCAVDVLPPEAHPNDFSLSSIEEQIAGLLDNRGRLLKESESGLSEKEKKRIHDNWHILHGQIGHLLKLRDEDSAQLAWAIIFYRVAEQVLPRELFKILCQETNVLTGRHFHTRDRNSPNYVKRVRARRKTLVRNLATELYKHGGTQSWPTK